MMPGGYFWTFDRRDALMSTRGARWNPKALAVSLHHYAVLRIILARLDGREAAPWRAVMETARALRAGDERTNDDTPTPTPTEPAHDKWCGLRGCLLPCGLASNRDTMRGPPALAARFPIHRRVR